MRLDNIILTCLKDLLEWKLFHEPIRVISACFVFTHIHSKKIFKKSPNIELLQTKHTLILIKEKLGNTKRQNVRVHIQILILLKWKQPWDGHNVSGHRHLLKWCMFNHIFIKEEEKYKVIFLTLLSKYRVYVA